MMQAADHRGRLARPLRGNGNDHAVDEVLRRHTRSTGRLTSRNSRRWHSEASPGAVRSEVMLASPSVYGPVPVSFVAVALLVCSCAKAASLGPTAAEVPEVPSALDALSAMDAYIASMHTRIHRQFAERFLPELAKTGDRSFSDPRLAARLEIVVNRDGTLHRVGLVNPSRSEVFSQGAFQAVVRAQPFPAPPPEALSGDGRVYLHWSFHRNQMQCGTFRTELFALQEPVESTGGVQRLRPRPLVPRGTPAALGPKTRPDGQLDPTKYIGRGPAALEQVCRQQAGRFKSRGRTSSCWITAQRASLVARYSDDVARQVSCVWSTELYRFSIREILEDWYGEPSAVTYRDECLLLSWSTSKLEIGYKACAAPMATITWWAEMVD